MPRWTKILLSIVLLLGVLLVAAYAFRSELATVAAGYGIDRMKEKGTRCNHPTVEIARSLDRATVTKLECSIAKGPLARFETFGLTRLKLSGFRIAHIDLDKLVFHFREEKQRKAAAEKLDNVESNTFGDLANIAGMRDQLMKGILDAAEMYSPEAQPPMTVGTMITMRGGKKETVMYGYKESRDGEWAHSQAKRLETGVEGLVSARNYEMRVTKKRARMTVGLYLGDAERGEEPDVELRLVARDLDRPKPHVEMSLDDESAEARKARSVAERRNSKAPRE